MKSSTNSKARAKKTPAKRPVKAPARAAKSTKKPVARAKPSFRRRWLPPIAGILVFLLVFGFFNSQLVSSRIAYYLGSRVPAAQLDAKTIASPISPHASQITINAIKVNAPIIFESQNNETTFLGDLQHGVVHYPNTAVPGQEGNVVIFGHSSGVWWEQGDYKFVFTLLDKVQSGDKIFIDYQGTRYIYRVTGTQVVSPDNLSVLNQSSGHDLTLITCTPVGTSTNRLIIHAAQYVPKPVNNSSSQPAKLPTGAKGILPGNDSSTLHNLRTAL